MSERLRACRRRALRPAWPLVVAAAFAGLLVAHARAVAQPQVRLEQLGRHTWYTQGVAALASPANRGFISNAGVIVTPAGIVIVDALGSPLLGRELLAAVRALPGVAATTPIRAVVVTHYHADHIYGLQVLKAAGAPIWAHASAREYLASEGATERLAHTRAVLAPLGGEPIRLVGADRWLSGDVALELGAVRVRVLHAGPSHTPEDLLVYVEPDGVVYAGDLVFRGRLPFVGNADSRGWLRALERIITLAPRVLVPGHGPATRAPASDLAFTRDYLAHLRNTMGRAVTNFESFEDAFKATDWSRYQGLPLYEAAHRMNAFNTYLLMEREALGK